MQRKQTANVLTLWGRFNIVSPFPLLVFTAFWTIAVMACFGFNDESPIALGISMLPLLIHPISCIAGFIFALRRRHVSRRDAGLCMTLSAAGFAENILICCVLAFLGSIG